MSAPASDQDINQLLKLSELDLVFTQGIKELQPMFDSEAEQIVSNITGTTNLNAKQLTIAQQLSQAMSKTTEKALFDPQVRVKLQQILKTVYTDKEVKAYNAFLSTPEGQAINRKNSQVTIEIQKFMEDLIQKTAETGTVAEEVERIIAPLFEE